MVMSDQPMTRASGATTLAPLFLLSLVLINAQAVTALTSERDVRAMDLLLVSDLTPKEIVFGKLGGVLYNTKEMVLLPILLCGYLCYAGTIGLENTIYLAGGLLVLDGFVAVLGIHAGMNYANSRSAVAISLGTVFFLFLGVATCMWMMVVFSGSFEAQLQPFLAFMVGGGVGLYVALGARNPSTAIGVASFLCPFATFYAITSLFLNQTLGVFLVIAAAYGFTASAMLIPAICEFDVATGRTTIEEQ
jgi:ABC-type transport system involved in multi-copper enzyme maturation permease subunit